MKQLLYCRNFAVVMKICSSGNIADLQCSLGKSKGKTLPTFSGVYVAYPKIRLAVKAAIQVMKQ